VTENKYRATSTLCLHNYSHLLLQKATNTCFCNFCFSKAEVWYSASRRGETWKIAVPHTLKNWSSTEFG